MRKVILFLTSLCIWIFWIVYAADIPIFHFIEWQSSDYDGSYSGFHKTQTLGVISRPWMTFFNKGNDNISIGDFFRWYYYDTMYGAFKVDSNVNQGINLEVSNVSTSQCRTSYNGYFLKGHSYNREFWFMNFNNRGDGASPFICFPQKSADGDTAYLGWYAYNPYIGFQNIDGLKFDSTIDICDPAIDPNCVLDDGAEGRYIYVEGTATSHKSIEWLTWQFEKDVRIIGKIEKASAKRDIHKKVQTLIKNAPIPTSLLSISDFNDSTWGSIWSKSNRLWNDTVLYIKNPSSVVSLNAVNSIRWKKTIIVENGSISIDTNLINGSKDAILWIIVLKWNASESGNIYIAPNVTDIHAIMYTEQSILSKGANYSQSNIDFLLKNQLYIHGSIMSENTIGGSVDSGNILCPFYVAHGDCTTIYQAQKYDLNFLRTYKISPIYDSNGSQIVDSAGDAIMVPANGWLKAQGDGTSDFSMFPLIIQYNPVIQTAPPPLF